MHPIALVLAVLLLGLGFLAIAPRLSPAQVAGVMRNAAPVGLTALGLLLLLRGQMGPATALFGLAGALWGRRQIQRARTGARSAGQESRTETGWLEMRLDHDSGRLDGRIRRGRHEGALLSALSLDELRAFRSEVDDENSRKLIEAYLDKTHPGWREAAGGPRGGGATGAAGAPCSSGAMTVAEACEILGLSEGASVAEIKDAHRRLMQQLHPDRGGTDYFAAKLNAAKDLLLMEAGEKRG